MSSDKLTGRTRHRVGWLGSLILQVEYERSSMRDLNGSGYYDFNTATHWRDARAADLINLAARPPKTTAKTPRAEHRETLHEFVQNPNIKVMRVCQVCGLFFMSGKHIGNPTYDPNWQREWARVNVPPCEGEGLHKSGGS